MSTGITVTCRVAKPPGLNQFKRMSKWAYKRARDDWQLRLSLVTRGLKIAEPCHLVYTVHTSLWMDWDNAASSAKLPLDALVRLGVLPDDNTKWITSMDIRQDKCPRKDVGFTMLFTPISLEDEV